MSHFLIVFNANIYNVNPFFFCNKFINTFEAKIQFTVLVTRVILKTGFFLTDSMNIFYVV